MGKEKMKTSLFYLNEKKNLFFIWIVFLYINRGSSCFLITLINIWTKLISHGWIKLNSIANM
jgi:hypothetical protein